MCTCKKKVKENKPKYGISINFSQNLIVEDKGKIQSLFTELM